MALNERTGCASNKGTMSPARSTTGSEAEKLCRICLDSCNTSALVAPCKCAGSAKYAHEACLLQWFFRSKKKTCELCLSVVNVKPVGFKPLSKWRLPSEHCDFIFYLFSLYCIIMFVFTGMILWIASQGCTSPVCITLYVICAMSMMYFVYCCGCVEYSKAYWRACLSANRIWKIYDREDGGANAKKKSGNTSSDLEIGLKCIRSIDALSIPQISSPSLRGETSGNVISPSSTNIRIENCPGNHCLAGSPISAGILPSKFDEQVLSTGSICILTENNFKTVQTDNQAILCSDKLVRNFAINFCSNAESFTSENNENNQACIYVVSIPERDYDSDISTNCTRAYIPSHGRPPHV